MTFKSEIILCGEPVKISTHSDGAVSIKIPTTFQPSWLESNIWNIEANIKDPSGMLGLIYLLDHLNTNIDYIDHTFALDLSYFPNARQDRVTGDDEYETPNTLKTFCNLLESYKCLTVVYASDVHSNVPSILVNKLSEQNHLQSFIVTVPLETVDQIDYFISPDLGAYKKVKSIADNYDLPYLVAQKERHPVTREIELSLTTNVDLTGKTVMICDDILDGGRTFIELSKILKETYKVDKVLLYITHGLFSYNFDKLCKHIDKIYCRYSWKEFQGEDADFIMYSELF